jgi:hypothetical protein
VEPVEKIRQLTKQVQDSFGAVTELTVFGSGSAMLDVRSRGRVFVLVYSPTSGFGVDEARESDAFDTGYRFITQDFESAAEELRRLLRH